MVVDDVVVVVVVVSALVVLLSVAALLSGREPGSAPDMGREGARERKTVEDE